MSKFAPFYLVISCYLFHSEICEVGASCANLISLALFFSYALHNNVAFDSFYR